MPVSNIIKKTGQYLTRREPWNRRIVICLLAVLYLPAFIINAQHHIETRFLSSGSKQYFLGAYHMVRHGTYSKDFKDTQELNPTSYHPPGYSLYLAGCLTFIPFFWDMRLQDITSYDDKGGSEIHEDSNKGFIYIKYSEAFLILITSLLCFWITLQITEKPYAAILVLVWVGFHPKLSSAISGLHSEILQAFLGSLFSICMYYTAKTKYLRLFFISGLLLGYLSLTRGTWYYYCVPAIIIFFLMAYQEPEYRKKIWIGSGLFFFCFILLAGGWKARNYYHFNRAFMAERGGLVLDIRMNINSMNWNEYWASFFMWSKDKYFRKTLLKKYFSPEDYKRLIRKHPDSFYQKARNRRSELNQKYPTPVADQIQLNEALDKFFQNPFQGLHVTVPITYRGIQKYGNSLTGIMILLFSAFALISSLVHRNMLLIVFLCPVALMFLFNCFLTHNLPRFNLPYFPIMLVAAFIGLDMIWQWVQNKRRKKLSYPEAGSKTKHLKDEG